jgi:hypothetical protein
MEKSKNIYQAIVMAQAAAQAVAKGSTNTFHRYKYASAEAVIEEARVALNSAGLAVVTMGWVCQGAQLDSNNEELTDARVVVSYRMIHESGETLDMQASTPIIPDKGRPSDKAEMAALTMNLSYFLRGLLLLPREDESSAIDQRDDRNYVPKSIKRPDQAGGFLVEAISRIESADSIDALKALSSSLSGASKTMTESERAELRAAYNARKAALENV